MNKEYFMGLDMGTSSVGWAVTDMDYKLIKFKGQDMWGIREFDEAQTAVDRRTKRISRRRRQRQKARIGLLYNYFHDEIEKVDPHFYQRIKNSKYYLEDKDEQVRYKYSLFNDKDYTDVEYYKEFPTIFHLRKELIENPEKHDIRLVFLALLNMFKRRGHFLNAGLNMEASTDINALFITLNKVIEECYLENGEIENVSLTNDIDSEEIKKIFSDKNISRTEKQNKICELLGITKKDKIKTAFVKAICGLKITPKDLFGEDETIENLKYEIKFSEASYADKETEVATLVGETKYALIEALKNIYDCGTLLGILGDDSNGYLSFARVAQYEKHKEDLKLLKALYKEYFSEEEYNIMFRSGNEGTYSAYVNSFNSDDAIGEDKKQRRSFKKRTRVDFYDTLKKSLTTLEKKGIEDERIDYIKQQMEKENFLSKQLTSDNGVIPNQVHSAELKKILENASKHYEFLNEKDEYNLTVAERIVKLYEFQIPYYIGPTSKLSEHNRPKCNKGNGWVERKDDGKVLPWNIEEKIDVDKTSEKFIERLIRKCSYLNGEKVMPKQSLMYQKYCVLNEINNIRIDGNRIDADLKKNIFNDLFCEDKKVTKDKLCKYLHSKGKIEDKGQVTGIDVNINNQLSSYAKMKIIFGDKIKEDKYQNIAEDIIRTATIYGDSKAKAKKVLKKNYSDILSDKDIDKIIGFRFKDWGRLSKEFLCLQGCNTETGEIMSIIHALMDDNKNLMELINSQDYTFKEELEKKNKKSMKSLSEFEFEDLDDYYFSAPVKRMIWQTTLVIKEVEKIMGRPPKRLFIEMTRSDDVKGDKGRKDSREKQLLELFSNIKDEQKYWKELISKEAESGRLKSKKMYLYITQMGRCMYSGEKISLDELFDDNKYDIDHIYPRHFVKDDNLTNNLVLAKKELNQEKGDIYPIINKIRNNPEVRNLWKMLHDNKLINDEKYGRLTRNYEFTDNELGSFIARQIVETGQATKAVADFMKELLAGQTEIVYPKGSIISDFRRNGLMGKNDDDEHWMFPKSRLVNDFHHANDAYLNIVVGNAYYVKFTRDPYNFIRNYYRKDEKKYNYNFRQFLSSNIERNGEIAWIANPKEGQVRTIDTVKKMMSRNTPILSRMNLVVHGRIAEETLYGKKVTNQDNYIPIKSKDKRMNDMGKYGGFSGIKSACLFLVEYEECKKTKKQLIRTIETLPLYLCNKDIDIRDIEEYCVTKLKLNNPKILIPKIKMNSLFKIDGYYVHITGKTGDQYYVSNAVSMCLEKKWIEYIKIIENFLEKESNLSDLITYEKNCELYELIIHKHSDTIFKYKPLSVTKKLIDGYDVFKTFERDKQCKALIEILKLSSISNGVAELSIINQTNSSAMKVNKKISLRNEFYLINQSVTGLYENRIDLKTV